MEVKKIPKGDMCCTCVHALRYCAHLDFDSMKPIGQFKQDGIQYVEVRCTDHRKEKSNDRASPS